MSLYRRNRVWWSRQRVGGICYDRSTKTKNRRLAERIDQQHREEIIQRRYQRTEPKPEMMFAELAGRFCSEGGVLPWHRDRLKVLLPDFAIIEIGGIDSVTLSDYRRRRKRQKSKLSESTLNRDAQCLRRILNWAVEQGFLSSNPLANLHLPQERLKRRGVLGLLEEPLLLRAAAPHSRAIIICALDAGLRRSEILTQLAEDIDFERRVLSVTRSKTAGDERREIPLTSRLYDLLASKDIRRGLLFTFDGDPIRNIKTAWKGAVRRAGIRALRFHDLRHTFNTRLMEAGVIQDVRRELMGHSSGGKRNTNLIYTHVELPQKRAAIRKLERWVEVETEVLTNEQEEQQRKQSAAAAQEGGSH